MPSTSNRVQAIGLRWAVVGDLYLIREEGGRDLRVSLEVGMSSSNVEVGAPRSCKAEKNLEINMVIPMVGHHGRPLLRDEHMCRE